MAEVVITIPAALIVSGVLLLIILVWVTIRALAARPSFVNSGTIHGSVTLNSHNSDNVNAGFRTWFRT